MNVENAAKMYAGEVVYIYAFDVSYDMKREPIYQILSQPVHDYSIGPSKRNPKYQFFYSAQMAVLPSEMRQIADGSTVEIRRSVKLFDVGSISIQVRVPFQVGRIEDLVGYHDLEFQSGSLEKEVYDLAERLRQDLTPHLIKPVAKLSQAEAYTVFCINSLPDEVGDKVFRAEDWLLANRRRIAGVITQEQDSEHLSEQEAAESTSRYCTYYDRDLVLVDWDSAIVVNEQESLDDILHIMELANVQLAELAAYDRHLDGSLEKAYRDVAGGSARGRREVLRDLREIRVDLARLTDELLNITKFFGDWHLANIYRNLANRFHLGDWHSIIDEKLKTLDELYTLLQQDHVNFTMFALEAAIVLLFVIDLVILIIGLKH